jgi:hypothetical protein
MLCDVNRERWRAAAFVLLLAGMMAGPFTRQVLGIESPWLRDWAMFGGAGLPLIDARFFTARSGSLRPIDRRILDAGHSGASTYRPLLTKDSEVVEAARALCKALGPDADVRVVTRQAVRHGWVAGRDGAENLCAGPA